VLLGLKQLTFVLMAFFSFGYARMLRKCTELASSESVAPYYRQMVLFGRITVALGISALLLSSGLH
jgi:hypothetical protein